VSISGTTAMPIRRASSSKPIRTGTARLNSLEESAVIGRATDEPLASMKTWFIR